MANKESLEGSPLALSFLAQISRDLGRLEVTANLLEHKLDSIDDLQ
eukprot:gene1944-12936_t